MSTSSLADGRQHLQSGGRTVDELAVGAGGGKDPLENQLIFRARFQAVFLEEFFHRVLRGPQFKHGFDGATVAAGADEHAVGAFAEEEVEARR